MLRRAQDDGKARCRPERALCHEQENDQEKVPWKNLPGIENKVEAEFLRLVLLGESILPYRTFRSFEAVVPVSAKGEVLDAEAAANRGFDGLRGWMSKAEKVWNANSESGSMTLIGRWNYHNELGAQFPIAKTRVVFAASGTIPAACILREPEVVEHSLYWSKSDTEEEALYLTALFNSEIARVRGESLQSRGQWGARHFDKVIFNLPIPRFDASNLLHNAIAEAARDAETFAACVPLPENINFQRARGLIRAALTEAGVAQKIDALVIRLLDGV